MSADREGGAPDSGPNAKIERLREDVARLETGGEGSEEERLRGALLFMLEDVEANRTRIEQAHREWVAAFDGVRDPIFFHDEEFRIVRANRAYAERAGLSVEDVIGKRYFEIFPKRADPLLSCRTVVPKKDADAEAAEETEEEVRIESGESFLSRSFAVRAEDGAYLFSVHILTDITRRKRAEETLLTQSKLLEAFFESTLTYIAILDKDFNFVRVNEAYARADERSVSDFPGRNHFEMYPSDAKPIFERVVATKQPHKVVARPFVYANRPERGTTYWDWTLEPILDGKGDVDKLIFMLANVTERVRAESGLRDSEEKFRAMATVATDAVILVDNESRVRFWNTAAERIFGWTSAEALGQSIHEFHLPERYQEAAKRGFAEFVKTGKGPVIGKTIELAAQRKDGTEVPVELAVAALSLNGEWHAVGIVRDITERKTAIRHQQESMRATIRAIASTIEERDPYTAGHQQRVTKLASAIAWEMGLSEDRIQGLEIACAVHDVGKIGIPAEILSKPGKLSDVEFALIRTHCQAGHGILKDIEFPWPVARMVLEHHERLDGSGYPHGRKGDEILMESKILTVADVVEAMMSHRPYRPSLGLDVALAEVTKNRGTFYDPAVVDACVKLFREKGFAFN